MLQVAGCVWVSVSESEESASGVRVGEYRGLAICMSGGEGVSEGK
jgi:hypothetical protein